MEIDTLNQKDQARPSLTIQSGNNTKPLALSTLKDSALFSSPLPCSIPFLILQHPQESKHPWNTAWILEKKLPQAKKKIGLSWKNLSAAYGAVIPQPSQWAVLFLGTQKQAKFSEEKENPTAILQAAKGFVLLDGNWKQAKTLWWRNPWLLRLKRISLLERKENSLYNSIRKKPRPQCLSTLETVAEILRSRNEVLHAESLENTLISFIKEY